MSTVTTAPAPAQTETGPTPQAQAGILLNHVAGYMAVRTVEMGLRAGLVGAIAARPGSTPDDLADLLDLDQLYVSVWCRAAFAAGALERVDAGYRMAPHMDTLLFDDSSPAYAGGLFPLVRQPEMFGRFDESLHSGERLWWDDTSANWIAGVAATGRPSTPDSYPVAWTRSPVLPTACSMVAGSWTRPVVQAQASSGWLRDTRTVRSWELTGINTPSTRLRWPFGRPESRIGSAWPVSRWRRWCSTSRRRS